MHSVCAALYCVAFERKNSGSDVSRSVKYRKSRNPLRRNFVVIERYTGVPVPCGAERPVARIVNEPVFESIIDPAGSLGSHAGLPFAGISSIVYSASVELGSLRHLRVVGDAGS